MQIGEGLYIDLEIVNLDRKEFLTFSDILALNIVETSGTSLPYLYMKFRTTDKDIKDYIIKGNKVIVKIGTTPQDCDSFEVTIYSNNPPNSVGSGTGWILEFAGFIGDPSFMISPKSASYDGNSLLVAKQIIKEYSGVDPFTDIDNVKEKQVTWVQANKTNSYFLAEVLLHMNIAPSFPLFTFNKYGGFIISDFKKLLKKGPSIILTPMEPQNSDEVQFFNNFNVESFKSSFNYFSGYNKLTAIYNNNKGNSNEIMSKNSPIIATTQESEEIDVGNIVSMNKIQSGNVHEKYKESYVYNTNKIVSLSSEMGIVVLAGNYYRGRFTPLDLVKIKDESILGGLYLIDTINIQVDFTSGTVLTYLYLSRDNRNNVENNDLKKKSLFQIRDEIRNSILSIIHDLKVAYAFAIEVIDGEYLERWLSFAIATKTNLLRSFTVAGVPIDFNSQANLLTSLIRTGNSLMNTLVDMIFPESIAYTLQDFIINKPSLISLISRYVAEYVPLDLQSIIMSMATSLFKTTDSLNSIAKDNGIKVTTETRPTGEAAELATTETSEINYQAEGQNRVNEIIEDFENNTTGLDIPYPVIELSESQSLYSEKELRNYIATITIENLTNLGYLKTEEDQQDLKDILLGEKPIDFNLINRVNNNAGYTYNYRYWGVFGETNEAMYAWSYEDKVVYTKTEEVVENTRLFNYDYSPYSKIEFKVFKENNKYVIKYKDYIAERNLDKDIVTNALAELTSFNIKKSYKDKYRTIPCTKIISASKNQRIYFTCPKKEEDLKFYINAKRIELPSFEIDLGYVDAYGVPVIYNVYYTETGFNSNSVLFEVKKGGMV